MPCTILTYSLKIPILNGCYLLHNSNDLAGLHEICAVLAYGQLYDTALKKDSVDSFKKVFENISMEFNYASDYEGNEITELIFRNRAGFSFSKGTRL